MSVNLATPKWCICSTRGVTYHVTGLHAPALLVFSIVVFLCCAHVWYVPSGQCTLPVLPGFCAELCHFLSPCRCPARVGNDGAQHVINACVNSSLRFSSVSFLHGCPSS